MTESEIRERIARFGKSIYERGLTAGSTGNISVMIDDGWLMTPTGSSLGDLDPARISKLDRSGNHVSGDEPTKEAFLHHSVYSVRPNSRAIVHLHSTHSVAVSCMRDVDHDNVLPPLTAYHVMRVGKLPLIPYFPPGDRALAKAVEMQAADHHAILLANHGPVVAGATLEDAVHAAEELEETAKLHLLLEGKAVSLLTKQQVEELTKRFPHRA